MNRLLFCETWSVSKLTHSLGQCLEGIISLFVTQYWSPRQIGRGGLYLPAFLATGFFAGALARGLAAAFGAAAFFLAAFGASSASSAGFATFSFFGRGPIEGLALSAR